MLRPAVAESLRTFSPLPSGGKRLCLGGIDRGLRESGGLLFALSLKIDEEWGMTKRKTLPGLRFFLLLALAAVGSCTGGPAAPPAPLAEIPAVMALPQDLRSDGSTAARARD